MSKRMASRQHHKKSRKGCTCCKKRHLKCDEQGPPCSNCRVRGLDCTYDPIVEQKPLLLEPKSFPDIFASTTSRCTELELFHQWSTDTYRAMIFQSEDNHLWQVTIPRCALEHDYLLNSILALSALHASTVTTPMRSKSYQLLALEYHNLAFAAFQAKEREATLETHQSLFAFSIVNFVFAVALPACLDREIENSSILGNLSTIFSLIRGTVNIHRLAWAWLLDGPFANFIRANSNMPTEALSPDTSAAFDKLRVLRDEEYAALSVVTDTALNAVRTYEITNRTIEELETCFRINSKDKMVVCFRWLAMLDEEFVVRITNSEPFALLVAMYWAILLDRLGRDKWWAKLAGKGLVAETSKLLYMCKPEWCSIMSWVHREVGLPPLAGSPIS